jgi:DNA repair protein RecN (Recombination protein N)
VLRRLTVKNLAIVEDLDLELSPGLTVITGETGAGKSILVDALALLAGGRGSADLVRKGATRLVVAGEFDVDPAAIQVLEEAGLPASPTLLLRRELTPDGRGRAFVEDEPASVRTLGRAVAGMLAIQGQNSERELAESGAPLELLDAFAEALGEREAVAAAASAWSAARRALEELEEARRGRADRLEMLEFQIREVDAVSPDPSEEADLAAERERLRHAGRIHRAGEAALLALSEGEDSAADRLGEAVRAFAELSSIDPREAANLAEAEELKRRIADLAAAARDAAGDGEADPERLTAVESRLEALARVKRKYGQTLEEVLARRAAMGREREELANFEDALERRRREEQAAAAAWSKAADALTAKRRESVTRLSRAVEREVRALAMEKAGFRVLLDSNGADAPRSTGRETATFLFAPNPGEPEKPLEKIASGGELSRVQLAIRSVASAKTVGRALVGRTLVFDEVDAGIGGRTADLVGKRLRDLARHDQVLCVTHVPQIAALADGHYVAEKSERKGRTIASVRPLSGRERVAEIARMLAGEKVPETALKHARALLEAAAR